MIIRCLTAGAGALVLLAGPAPAASPTDMLHQFTISSGPGRGLVAVTQGPTGSELSFTVSGLKARSRYTMVVSSRGCSSTKGTIFRRGFTTDDRGLGWDPVLSRATAPPKSVRILKAGRTVTCSAAVQTYPPLISTIKVDRPKALVTFSRSAQWTASLAVGGLAKNTRYQFAAVQGGCTPGARTLMGGFFTTDRKGFGRLGLKQAPVAGYTVDAVGVIKPGTGRIIFCETL